MSRLCVCGCGMYQLDGYWHCSECGDAVKVVQENNGRLNYNAGTERFQVVFTDDNHDDLCCGYSFDILIRGNWITTRIEYSDTRGWYLVGVSDDDWSIGTPVRVK